jgi:hypothetical protein
MKITIDNITEFNNFELKEYENKDIGKISIEKVKFYLGGKGKDIRIMADGWEDMVIFLAQTAKDNGITLEELGEYLK